MKIVCILVIFATIIIQQSFNQITSDDHFTIGATSDPISSNLVQEVNQPQNEDDKGRPGGQNSFPLKTSNITSSIKCSFCVMAVNFARKFLTKPSSFEVIHGIISEMCSVVQDYEIECYDVAAQIVDSYVIVFNRTDAVDSCLQVNLCG
uniref:Saposin B-type domain-containing protein n=1 Tax=Trichobilharzia regenti TaxID=157069 RepID=A0AA85K7F6_TRIRE|nr:unnamed protein product [Trichobilharzia regenti]